jgi:hypothetical protein
MDGRSTAGGNDAKVALRKSARNEGGKGDGGLHLENSGDWSGYVVEADGVDTVLVVDLRAAVMMASKRRELPAYLYQGPV